MLQDGGCVVSDWIGAALDCGHVAFYARLTLQPVPLDGTAGWLGLSVTKDERHCAILLIIKAY